MSAPGLIYADETYRIQGAAYEVNRVMGAGFLEAVYQECLALEFHAREIPFTARPTLALIYKREPLKQTYSPDFICFDRVLVELKAVQALGPEHRAQLLNCLSATGCRVGLLVNFGSSPKAQIERFAL